MNSRQCLTVAAVCFAIGCAQGGDRPAATDSTASASKNPRPVADSSVPAPSATGWSVRPDGIGPIRIGMPANDARRILGLPPLPKPATGCSYIDGAPSTALHAAVMLTGDTVVRFDVRDKSIATAEGARVGDTEARVQSLYAGRISVQPHKYLQGGHYLVVPIPRTRPTGSSSRPTGTSSRSIAPDGHPRSKTSRAAAER